MNIDKITQLLPHRYPFLLVDRVDSIVEGKTIKCTKCVTVNEPFFQGHFPNIKIMPGVMLLESLAQCSGLLAINTMEEKGKLFFLSGIDKVRFRSKVIPGMVLNLTSTLIKTKRGFYWFDAKAFVNDELAVSAEILLAISNEAY